MVLLYKTPAVSVLLLSSLESHVIVTSLPADGGFVDVTVYFLAIPLFALTVTIPDEPVTRVTVTSPRSSVPAARERPRLPEVDVPVPIVLVSVTFPSTYFAAVSFPEVITPAPTSVIVFEFVFRFPFVKLTPPLVAFPRDALLEPPEVDSDTPAVLFVVIRNR